MVIDLKTSLPLFLVLCLNPGGLISCTNAQPTLSVNAEGNLGLLNAKATITENLASKGYLVFLGTCSPLVKKIEFSALLHYGANSNWIEPNSAETPAAGESSPGNEGIVFDGDCSDGAFSIYVFRHDINTLFTRDGHLGIDNLSSIQLRGSLEDGQIITGPRVQAAGCALNGTRYEGDFLCHNFCGAGLWYNRGNHICETVGLGYFSPANDDSRSECPAGSSTKFENSASSDACILSGYQCQGLACGFTAPGSIQSLSNSGSYKLKASFGPVQRPPVVSVSGSFKLRMTATGGFQ